MQRMHLLQTTRHPRRMLAGMMASAMLLSVLTGCASQESSTTEAAVSSENGQTTAIGANAQQNGSDTRTTDQNGSQSVQTDAQGQTLDAGTTANGGNTPDQTTAPNGTVATVNGTRAQPPQTSAGAQTTVATTETPEESSELKEIKHIYLRDSVSQYDGSGIRVDGGKITISKGGTYVVSGTLPDGQIYVAADGKKVQLQLNDANITNSAGSAIFVQQAKKVTIYTMPGTTNTLSDGGTHDTDNGTIFSEDTVVLDGEGVLNINAQYAHGVQSDDDIVVKDGTLNITSAKSGLHSNDGIEINGGTLFCDAGTNGIKTDGFISITGGLSILMGGVREEKGAIYCDGVFSYTGGMFYAIGNTCTMPNLETTTAPVLGFVFASKQSAGTLVNVSNAGRSLFTMTSPRDFKYVVYGGPQLTTDAQYTMRYGGTVAGGNTYHAVTTGGTYSGGKAETVYHATGMVSFFSVF